MSVIGGPLDRQPLINRLPPPEDFSTAVDSFYEAHRELYETDDFALPFLELVIASQNANRNKEWVVEMHQALIEKAYDPGELIAEIAAGSAASLYDALLKSYQREYFHYYYTLNYDSSVPTQPKITSENKHRVVCGLQRDFSDRLHDFDAGGFLYHVHSIPDITLFREHCDQLRGELLHSSLDQIFSAEGSNPKIQKFYLKLAPTFFNAFQEAYKSGSEIQRGNPGVAHCCCPIL
jgi:hypothetical protein